MIYGFFSVLLSHIVIALPTIVTVWFSFFSLYALKMRAITIAITIFGRKITLGRAIKKQSKELILRNRAKKEAKENRPILLFAIAILEKKILFCIFWSPILFLPTVS